MSDTWDVIQLILIIIIADRQLILRPRKRIGFKIHKYYPKGSRFQMVWYLRDVNDDSEFYFKGEIIGFDYGK